ncbi:glycerophosphoryl diester phosphodiesterase membrane domain-containing protein [Streptomyces sp. NPDC048641]|uniref:glycerophosphoryl diester phosphodiesterase membrane domain-containing protein n=1 Tax=unclassified Streptomyces TaxID=2593676 RepID=UPI00342708A1
MNDTPGWASPGSAPSDGQDDQPAQDGQNGQDGRNGRSGDGEDAAPDPKWSKEQPPPAQWSAPSGSGQAPPPPSPPSPPSQGWGGGSPGGPAGPGGYGGGYGGPGGGYGAGWGSWQGRPPAAKPGVIPLRPLGVGEILDGAVSTMRTHWRTVLGISLSVAVFIEIVVVLLQGLVLNGSTNTDALDDPSATASELTRAVGDALLSSGVVQIVYLLGTIVATALLTTVTSRAVLGKSVSTGEAWKDAKPQLLKLAGLTLLLPLIAAAVLLVCMLPGILVAAIGSSDSGAPLIAFGALGGAVLAIWLMIRFSLASPALMLEKQSILKSMSRSAKLVRGSWWRVFGIQLLAGIIAGLVSSIIVIPFTFLAASLSGEGVSGFLDGGTGDLGWTFLIVTGVGSVIGSMLTFPITAGVTVLLYIDQRIRREALDLELGRAAGLQGYSNTTGTTPGS